MSEKETPEASGIEFRVLDLKARKILRDSSEYHAVVARNDGVATVMFNREGLKELLFTGVLSPAGTKVYDGDIIEAMVPTSRGVERVTDAVYWRESAWRFGTFDGVLSDFSVMAVVGNRFETPWPIERPA